MNLVETAKLHLPFLYPGLVGKNGADQILRLASLFPEELSCDSLIFEHSLNHSNIYADTAVMLDMQKRTLYQLYKSLNSISNSLSKKQHWINFLRFLDHCQHEDALAKSLLFFWLIFDQNVSKDWPIDPCVYFRFNSHDHFHQIEPVRRFFTEEPLHPDVLNSLERCYKIASEFDLCIKGIGLMCTRSLGSVRIHMAGDSLRSCLQLYLLAIGYPFDVGPVLDLLKQLDPYLGNICLSFDVGRSIQDRIGIECYINTPELFFHEKEIWNKLLSSLSPSKIFSPEKKDLLLNWIGIQRITEKNSHYFLVRNLNHIKIIFDKTGISSIKSYLAVWPGSVLCSVR
ncbi:MAG: hypothetical protein ACHQT8_06755 [Chlamydiales bacterium]